MIAWKLVLIFLHQSSCTYLSISQRTVEKTSVNSFLQITFFWNWTFYFTFVLKSRILLVYARIDSSSLTVLNFSVYFSSEKRMAEKRFNVFQFSWRSVNSIFIHFEKASRFQYIYRVSQKKLGFVENCHWGPLGWARVKSWPIFEKFRKFSIW